MTPLLDQLAAAGIPCGEVPAPKRLPENWLAAATDQVLIRVSGPDAARFLQGQLTCDVERLDAAHSVLGAACTPKGRAYLTFRIARIGDDILLRAPRETAHAALERLRKYMAFFKAEATVLEDWAVIGVVGDTGDSLEQVGNTQALAEGLRLRVPDTVEGLERHEYWLPIDRLHDSLPAELTSWLAPSAWRLSDIRAGIGDVTSETVESFVPQMLNWHLLDGISFKKGCYTGQEIIARMRYLGQLKRTLVRLIATSPQTPTPGMSLLEAEGKAGELVTVVACDDGSFETLAVLQNDLSGPFRFEGIAGSHLEIAPLPYDVPDRQIG